MSRRRERRAADRGVVAVLSVFFVLLLLTFLAVIINLGRVTRSRGDLQHAADSAALAAASSLDVKPTGGPALGRAGADFSTTVNSLSMWDVANKYAGMFTMMNSYDQKPTVAAADIKYGFWHLTPGKCMFDGTADCGIGGEAAPVQPPVDPVQMFTVNAVTVAPRYSLSAYFGNFLGIGQTDMLARATVYGRRTRVPCALVSAVSICQLVDPNQQTTPATGFKNTSSTNGFSCPGTGGTLRKVFTSNEEMDPNALGRIDLTNRWVPEAGQQFMRIFTRAQNYDHCMSDATTMPAVSEYTVGMGLMTNQPRGNLQPVVNALVGVPGESGGQQSGRCLLGRKLVIPVVKPIGIETIADCANVCDATSPVTSPPPTTTTPGQPSGCISWPATDMQRVVGFVNITFKTIHCWHETAVDGNGSWAQVPLTAENCESATDPDPNSAHNGHLLAENCANQLNPGGWNLQGSVRIEADISCDAPVGPLDNEGGLTGGNRDIPQNLKTRLVR